MITAEQVRKLFEENGFPLDDARVDKLVEYERLLLDWNGKVNLVSRKETDTVFPRQIVGSVAFLFDHSFREGAALLDVGTGGGLPGIPLAIIRPDLRITVVDSIRKKIMAVADMLEKLRLGNVRAVCARAEALDPATVGTFDYIVARAVSSASDIVEWCGPLLRRPGRDRSPVAGSAPGPGVRFDPATAASPQVPPDNGEPGAGKTPIPPGSFILLKGGDLAGELDAVAKILKGPSVTVHPITVRGAEDMFTDKKIIVITP